jgi:hypothetical protein
MSFMDGMDLTLTPATTNPNSFGFGMSPGGGGGGTSNDLDGEPIGGRTGGGPGGGVGGAGFAFGESDDTSTSARKDLGSAMAGKGGKGGAIITSFVLVGRSTRGHGVLRLDLCGPRH